MPDPRSTKGKVPDTDPLWHDPGLPQILAGSGGGTPQPDPIQVTRNDDPAQTFDYRKSGAPAVSSASPTATPEILLPASRLNADTRHINADPVTVYNEEYVDGGKMAMPTMQLSSRHIEADPVDLQGYLGSPHSATIANRGMPEGGQASKYPEPPESPQAVQGIPPMLARPTPGAAARGGPRPQRAASAATASPKPPEAVFAQAASDAQESPDFLAYVRQRAQDKMDLAQAQGKADDARKWQDVANGFVRAGDSAAGRRTDEGALQQRLDNTQQPVRNVLQQQEAGRQSTNEALAQTQLSGKMWEQRMATQAADPNSPISKRTQGFLASTGLFKPGAEKFVSAADYEKALQAGTAGIHALALKAKIAHDNAEIQLGKDKLEGEKHHWDQEYDVGMFRARPTIPPQQQSDVEALISGARNVYDLQQANENAGFFDKLGSLVGVGTAAQTKKAVAPEIAKANAKGRVNPSGEIKENALLPGPMTPGGKANTQRRGSQFFADAEAKIKLMESDPRMNQEHVVELRRQLEEEKAREGGVPSAGGGPTHYLTNRAKGIRIAADANGNPLPGAKPERIP